MSFFSARPHRPALGANRPPRQALDSGDAERVDVVRLGHGDKVVTFGRAVVADPADAYAGGSFEVRLGASGLTASRTVFVYSWSGLAPFFTELADAWRGWTGVKEWESPEHDLRIEATFESSGHDCLRFTASDGPTPTWRAWVEVDVEAGEDMARIAREVESLFRSAEPRPEDQP
jgi:hypothetical protein